MAELSCSQRSLQGKKVVRKSGGVVSLYLPPQSEGDVGHKQPHHLDVRYLLHSGLLLRLEDPADGTRYTLSYK